MATIGFEHLSLSRALHQETRHDPYPLYYRLRNEDPVHWDPILRCWIVTRYNDVVTVLRHPSLSACRIPPTSAYRGDTAERLGIVVEMVARQMLFLDEPDHTSVRRFAADHFTPNKVQRLTAFIARTTQDLLTAAEEKTAIDIVQDLAIPLPSIVIAEILGLPDGHRTLLKRWSDDLAEFMGNHTLTAARVERGRSSVCALHEYVRCPQYRPSEPDDQSPGLLRAVVERAGERVTDAAANVALLFNAGHQTTVSLIANGLLTLIRWPDQLHKLRSSPELIGATVDEILRYESPIQMTARIAATDLTLNGKDIRAGQRVIAHIGAANRDPERFSDPDRFDIERRGGASVAFGSGSHFCLGTHLAKLEGEIALLTFIQRFPNPHLLDRSLTWERSLTFRTPMHLPVMVSAD